MANKKFRKTNGITGPGTLNRNMGSGLTQACTELGIGDTLIFTGGPEFNRISLVHADHAQLPGAKYLGLKPSQSKSTVGWLGDKDVADRHRDSWLPILHQGIEAHIGAVGDLDLQTLFCLFLYGQDSGHTDIAKRMLKELAARLPGEVRMGFTVIPHEKYLRDALRDEPDLPVTLKDQGFLECTGMIDNHDTPIVLKFGRKFQDALVVKGLASMMASIYHFQNMRSAADVTHALGRFCAVFGFSFGIRSIAPDPELGWYKPIRRLFGWQARGHGNTEDIITQTKEAGNDAINNVDWRAIDEDIDKNKQAFLIFTVPMRTGWSSLIPRVEHWLTNEYPYITALWARGPGTPRPDLASAANYWVQATLLFPLPDRPRPIQKIIDSPSLLRRSSTLSADNGKGTNANKAVLSNSGLIIAPR